MLENTEQSLTRWIENAFPPDAVPLIRATGSAYRQFKVIEDMAFAAGDRAVPTPHQMSQAVKRSAGSKGRYARGGGESAT